MGYSADDFFDDVVKKAASIEDISRLPADPRGFPKFLRELITLYGDGSFETGLFNLIEEPCFLLIDAELERKILGYLPKGYELRMKSIED